MNARQLMLVTSAAVTLTATAASPAGAAYFIQAVAQGPVGSETVSELNGATHAAVEHSFSQNGIFGQSAASLNLAEGSLRARTDTNVGSAASAEFYDELTFDLPDGMESADILVVWTVEGTVNHGDHGQANIGANLAISGLNADNVVFSDLNFQFGQPIYQELVSEGFHRFTFSDYLTVHDGEFFSVNMLLNVGMYHEGSADFGNTAFLNFDLPDGVAFASSSGVFLSNPISRGAIPEPSAWALMILGFSAAGVTLRRAKSRRARPAA